MTTTPTPEEVLAATDDQTLLRSFARLTHMLTVLEDDASDNLRAQRNLIQDEILWRMKGEGR